MNEEGVGLVKNVVAVVITIIIVLGCAYGIYKQIDDFIKASEPSDESVQVVNHQETLMF